MRDVASRPSVKQGPAYLATMAAGTSAWSFLIRVLGDVA